MANIEIGRNIAEIRERIAQAEIRAGSAAQKVTLIAVSKKVSADRVMGAVEEDIRDFGESYVKEALDKISHPPLSACDLNWHFIGHLQRNKVREAVGKFDLIHSVDSAELAEEISRRSVMINRVSKILLEIRLDNTAPKYGILPEYLEETVEKVGNLPGVQLQGLMGIPPYSERADDSRPHFKQMKTLFDRLPERHREILSIGMSGDFEVAIEEGATHVRVGTAIFGAR